MKKVFSKKKFIMVEGYAEYKRCKKWVDECDGLTEEEMRELDYYTSDSWMV